MFKTNAVAIFLGVFALFAVAAPTCQVTILSSLWFRSMTEMVGEKEYPEVIVLENEYIQVWSVPNRGRIIFDLVYKPTGHSQLFTERNPLPLRFRKLYTFEFGGVYSSFPWHKRDNVPLPLEIKEIRYQETCVFSMSVVDPETHILVSPVLNLPPGSAECLLEVVLFNPTMYAKKIDFGLIVCARPGGQVTYDTQIIIPIHSIKVEQSDGEWMGKVGSEVKWPAEWSRWGNFKGAGSFSFALQFLATPEISIYNPSANEELCLRWSASDPWTACEIFSWGPNFYKVMGAFDGFRIEFRAENLLVIPGIAQSLRLYIGVKQR